MTLKRKTARANTTSHHRRIVLYLPNEEAMVTWHKTAERNNMTTSNFVQEIVNNHLENNVGKTTKDALESRIQTLENENRELRNENLELSKRVKRLDTLTDRYEEELRNLRNKTYLETPHDVTREFEPKLIELFKQRQLIRDTELTILLQIKPTDSTSVKALMTQLEILQDYGLVKKTSGGYRWQE